MLRIVLTRIRRLRQPPTAMAALTMLVGVIDIVSALTPELGARVHEISSVLSLDLQLTARGLTLAAGVVLLLLASSLSRRKRRAWALAVLLVSAGAVLHVAKGLDVEESALNIAKRTPGVTNVIDKIEVDPVSPMDDRIRQQVARRVYGYPSLNKYAINPANPIRITVINGHVLLSGVVDNQSDKDVAGIQANTVPGVFSVTNNLQVAGQPEEKRQ